MSNKDVIDQRWESIQEQNQSVDPSELPYSERVDYLCEQIPDGYEETYHTLVGRGCMSRVAAAVCQYLAGDHGDAPLKTQAEAAAEFDVSEASVRQWFREYTIPSET